MSRLNVDQYKKDAQKFGNDLVNTMNDVLTKSLPSSCNEQHSVAPLSKSPKWISVFGWGALACGVISSILGFVNVNNWLGVSGIAIAIAGVIGVAKSKVKSYSLEAIAITDDVDYDSVWAEIKTTIERNNEQWKSNIEEQRKHIFSEVDEKCPIEDRTKLKDSQRSMAVLSFDIIEEGLQFSKVANNKNLGALKNYISDFINRYGKVVSDMVTKQEAILGKLLVEEEVPVIK